MIRRRHVFHIAGYDPVAASRQHRSFVRQAPIFAKTWNLTASVGDLQTAVRMIRARAGRQRRRGANWQIGSIYEPLQWDDLVRADMSRPMATRLPGRWRRSLTSLAPAPCPGTFAPIPNTACFFCFRFSSLPCLHSSASGPALGPPAHFELVGTQGIAVSIVVGAIVFLGLLQWPGRRWRVLQALDDWIFSLDYVHGRRPDVEARLDRFAERIIACARDPSVDEMVLSGHSMGATLAIDIMARALARDPSSDTVVPRYAC